MTTIKITRIMPGLYRVSREGDGFNYGRISNGIGDGWAVYRRDEKRAEATFRTLAEAKAYAKTMSVSL